MIFALALIPVIALLIFIYVKDKKEKEPLRLLIGLFFLGMVSVIPVGIIELIGEAILQAAIPYDEVLQKVVVAACLVGPAEEMGKYVMLRKLTWKSKHFDYSFDAIVYAVFCSLGFACIENVLYVNEGGLATAILRMFTAVPGHACFGVFMGAFYSKAKYADLTGNRADYKKYKRLALWLPALVHGIYDAILMGGLATGQLLTAGLSLLLWLVFVIAMFIAAVIVVVKASKNDFCFIVMPQAGPIVYRPSVAGSWMCTCGRENQLNFCCTCGKPRPMVEAWTCTQCGAPSTLKFCGRCGAPAPVQPYVNVPQQGMPQPYGNVPQQGMAQPYVNVPQPYGNMPQPGMAQPYMGAPMQQPYGNVPQQNMTQQYLQQHNAGQNGGNSSNGV
jgi:RsiW-degrading membrane proteinase PrsW (M82 family)